MRHSRREEKQVPPKTPFVSVSCFEAFIQSVVSALSSKRAGGLTGRGALLARGHRGGPQSNSEDGRETWKRRSDYSRAREAQRGALGAEDNKRGGKSKSSRGGCICLNLAGNQHARG